jgi:small-conductance mechanosensitive channel
MDREVNPLLRTRSHSWREVGLARQINPVAVARARREGLLLLMALVGVLVAYNYRAKVFGEEFDTPVRFVTVIALVIIGWAFARDVGRALGPVLFRRLDPGAAGTVGFLIRLATVAVAIVAALRIAGLRPQTLAVGGAFTAVVVGLAAQQTLGNLFAGTVLLSARPFRVGDRVRFQAGSLAGQVEGVVSSLGLLYTTLAQGEDTIMVPNSLILNAAVVPLREPASVDLRARLRPGVLPSDVQELLISTITTPTRAEPHIILEEVDSDEVVVRITATPETPADGPRLADEILTAVARVTGDEPLDGDIFAVAGTRRPPREDDDDLPTRERLRRELSAHARRGSGGGAERG